jgi:hypothetical protein
VAERQDVSRVEPPLGSEWLTEMSTLRIVSAAIACISLTSGMVACRPALRQMVLDISCSRTVQKPGMVFKATIHNGTSSPVSIVASYVLGGKEHVAPGLLLRLRQLRTLDVEDFSYWPEGDRSGGGTGSIIRRVAVVAPGALHEWSLNASDLFSPRTGRPFEGGMDEGEIRAVFNVRDTAPGRFPTLWIGTVESRGVQVPEDCKDGG